MARIRTIKPEFWVSEQVVECSRDARLLFIGLWNFCDDGGVHVLSPRHIRMRVFPGDDDITSESIQRLIDELSTNGLIELYECNGIKYLHVTGWDRHQKIDRPSPKYPKPDSPGSTSISQPARRAFVEPSPPEGKGREGKGEEVESSNARRATSKTPVMLPQTWTLTDDWRAAATKVRADSKLPPCNLDLEADAFLRYWTEGKGAGTKRPDWRSTWLNWIRKATSKPLEAVNGRPWEGYAPGTPKPAGIAIGSIEDINEREEMGLLTHAEADVERAKARARMAAR